MGVKKELSVNFNNKVLLLKELTSKLKFYNIVLKNNEFADIILIDEFQDTDLSKVELIIDLINNNLKIGCVVAGDILQTIFVDSIRCKNFINPMEFFKKALEPKYYEINTCFRCPAPHINFVNYLLGEQYKSNGLNMIISQNNDTINKPVLFGHDCISHNESAHKLALGIGNSIITLLKLDPEIKPDDITLIMKKSNSNYVFEHLKNILPNLLKKNNFNPLGHSDSYVLHFETNGDGYSNTINWEKATDKIVLVSIHGDKGKGHKVIFFLGLSRKSIPIDYNVGKSLEIFDISLLNVALTRSLKYLFIGFTFNSPSIYLSNKHDELDKYCYLAWDKNIYNYLEKLDNSIEKNIYIECIKKINECWFDKLPDSKKKPIFDKSKLQVPNLPIKTSLKVSQDISKDLSPFIEKIASDILIEEDCIDIYDSIKITIPESFYTIFGFVGELLLYRNKMIKTKNYAYFGWILNKEIYYTNSDNLINSVYDYKINKYINDISTWKDKLVEIELDFLISNDPNKCTNNDFYNLILDLQGYLEPIIIINEFYSKYCLKKLIENFCDDKINNFELCKDFKNIIILALFYAETNSDVRKDFLYSVTEKVFLTENIDKVILQICSNSNYVHENFISDNLVDFQKNISIDKKLSSIQKLKSYGLTYKAHRNIMKKGLPLSINGICDIYNQTTNTLIEIKTCLKTSFSNEWVLQIIVYNILLKITNQIDVKNNYIINLFDGSIYKININSDINILKSILKFYEFDDFLIDFLIG